MHSLTATLTTESYHVRLLRPCRDEPLAHFTFGINGADLTVQTMTTWVLGHTRRNLMGNNNADPQPPPPPPHAG